MNAFRVFHRVFGCSGRAGHNRPRPTKATLFLISNRALLDLFLLGSLYRWHKFMLVWRNSSPSFLLAVIGEHYEAGSGVRIDSRVSHVFDTNLRRLKLVCLSSATQLPDRLAADLTSNALCWSLSFSVYKDTRKFGQFDERLLGVIRDDIVRRQKQKRKITGRGTAMLHWHAPSRLKPVESAR